MTKAVNILKKIKFDSNYSNFNFLQSNRIVDSNHTEKMIKSIREMGIIRPVVCIETDIIDGVKKRFIIDGQHLFYACMREEIEVPYIIINVQQDMDLIYKMAMLNNSSKSWDLMNYIVAYKSVKADYQKLFDMKLKYNMEVSMIAAIGMNISASMSSAKSISSIIKEGKYIFSNPNADKMCGAFSDIFITIGAADRWVKFNFFTQFMQSYGNYDHAKTIDNIKKNIGIIKAMTDVSYAREFIQNKVFTS